MRRKLKWWGYIYYPLYRWWNKWRYIHKEVYWFFQRGKHGIATCDWWSLDRYLCKVARNGIERIMYDGCHLGCGTDWMFANYKMSDADRDEARRRHNLYKRILRFFELHEFLMDNLEYWPEKRKGSLRRLYKASGLLLIRNFGALWD